MHKSPAVIRITNLRLHAIVGVNEWERERRQALVLNIEMQFDQSRAVLSDKLEDTLDYRSIKKRVLTEVEQSSFFLIEKLADHILDLVMSERLVLSAKVKVDKPHALRYADSVSVEVGASRNHE